MYMIYKLKKFGMDAKKQFHRMGVCTLLSKR